jgi:hypothetical protein
LKNPDRQIKNKTRSQSHPETNQEILQQAPPTI